MNKRDFYIISVMHTIDDHLYITFWRPDDRGYCWALCNAGKYSEENVRAHLGYYNTGKDIAIPCAIVDPLSETPIPGHHDNDAGPVVANSKENWKVLLANVIEPLDHPVKPMYYRARKYKSA